jgi:hypothetical protein
MPPTYFYFIVIFHLIPRNIKNFQRLEGLDHLRDEGENVIVNMNMAARPGQLAQVHKIAFQYCVVNWSCCGCSLHLLCTALHYLRADLVNWGALVLHSLQFDETRNSSKISVFSKFMKNQRNQET